MGRLIYLIQPNGQAGTYDYDKVGNLLGVTIGTSTNLGAPAIDSITPGSIRIGGRRSLLIKGSHFLGGYLTTDNPGIETQDTQVTDIQINTAFSVTSDARLGTTTVTVSTPLGKGIGTVQILSPLLTVSPSQLTVEKGKSESMTLSLSEPLSTSTIVTLSISNPTLATTTDKVTINAGETKTVVLVHGIEAGFLTLQAQIEDNYPIESLVQVVAPFSGPAVATTQTGVSVFYPHLVGSGVTATQTGVSVFYPHLVGSGVAATQTGVSVFYPHLVGSGVAATQQPVSVKMGQ